MQRAQPIAVACFALLIACTDSSTDGGPPATSTTVTPTAPATMSTVPSAPTDCPEAPQMPACRPGHEMGAHG